MKKLIFLLLLFCIPLVSASSVFLSGPDDKFMLTDFFSEHVMFSGVSDNLIVYEVEQDSDFLYVRVYDQDTFNISLLKLSLDDLAIETLYTTENWFTFLLMNNSIILSEQNSSTFNNDLKLYDKDFNYLNKVLYDVPNAFIGFNNTLYVISYAWGDSTNTTFYEINSSDLSYTGVEHFFENAYVVSPLPGKEYYYTMYYDMPGWDMSMISLDSEWVATGQSYTDLSYGDMYLQTFHVSDEDLVALTFLDFDTGMIGYKVLNSSLNLLPGELNFTGNVFRTHVFKDSLYITFCPDNCSLLKYELETLSFEENYTWSSVSFDQVQVLSVDSDPDPDPYPELEYLFTQLDRSVLNSLYNCYILGSGCTPQMNPEKFWSYDYREIHNVRGGLN